ncbi:MAG TPA: adenylate/guanylate cyclase domain-containing protein [Nocardioidaceae bacterium]|nr:adenylate/guanylate cyclase domain-containing protein [Nocardioidaceae bacterium]
MPLCSQCGRDNPDGFSFCPSCGSPLTSSREVRKVVTVLFCDLVGSTALGEQTDPEALRALLKRYYAGARSAIERRGGLVEKFVGDAVMAVFGLPVARENDAVEAVLAAVELHEVVGRLNLRVRIGVNTGQVVAGAGDTLVTGDTVNTAARLEQAAAAGSTLLGEITQHLAADVVTTEPVEVAAKGKRDPVRAHLVTGLRPESGSPAHLPLVGRLAERAVLRDVYDDVLATSRCRLITVVGAPGIGKSRLVGQLVEEIADEAQVVSGRAVAYGEGMTYGPLVEILQQLDTPYEQVIQRSAADTIAACQVVLERAATERPLVVILDDLQWVEPAFLRLVTAISLRARAAPILMLCLARPELDTRHGTWADDVPGAVRLDLDALSPVDAGEVLRQALNGDAADEVLGPILRAADGNPLYLVQMAQHAVRTGSASIPPTIEALLNARLDSLADEARFALEAAAVEGEVFHLGSVSTLVERSSAEVEALLSDLARLQFVRPDRAQIPGESGYRFCHLLMRDAAYESLTKAARAGLHESHADWLVMTDGVLERDELAGHHLEVAAGLLRDLDPADANAAVLADRAGRHLADAGIRAAERDDNRAATNLLHRARALLIDPAARRGLIRYLFIAGYATEYNVPSIAPLLPELLDGTPVDRAMAGIFGVEEVESGLDEVEASAALLRESDDPLAIAMCRHARGMVLWPMGRTEESVSEVMAAFQDLRRAGIRLFATDIAYDLLDQAGVTMSAQERQRLIDELRSAGNDFGQVFDATVDSQEAQSRYLSGEIGAEEFSSLVGREEEACAQAGREIDQATAREVRTVLRPWVERDLRATEQGACQNLELERKTSIPEWRVDVLEASWALALCDVGSYSLALEASSQGEDRNPGRWNLVAAWACAGVGDAEGARTALALLRPHPWRPVMPRFDHRYTTGRALALLGDVPGARAALSDYIDYYTALGYHRIADRARADLAALESS